MAPSRPSGHALRARRAKQRAARRARRFAALALLGVVLLVTLLLTAFGSGKATPAQSVQPVSAARLLPAGPPKPLIVATEGSVQLQLPIARSEVTAIGYHGAGNDALALAPLGRRGNQGLLSRIFHSIFGGHHGGLAYYQLDGGSGAPTGELDVGAAPSTDVYAPVDGTIVGLARFVIDGHTYGTRIDIQPNAAPALVVSLTNLRADPALTVGSTVAAASTRLGTVLDLSRVERQALARYTQDAGNHVALQVHPAAALQAP